MGFQHFVQAVQHLRNAEICGAFHMGGEAVPEFTQHIFPVQFTSRYLVEFLFKIGGKAVLHILCEEAFQEGCNQASFIIGDEPVLVHGDIAAIAQNSEDARIGGGTTDAQFFHPLHERGFRETRWWLGEVLVCACFCYAQTISSGHFWQTSPFVFV